MLRFFLILAATVVTLATPAWGQTTQPADKSAPPPQRDVVVDDAWLKTVEGFAKSLASGDLIATEEALKARASVRRFDGVQKEELWRLAECAGGTETKAIIVGQHGYIHPPLVMAADIAADFKNATAVPDNVKAKFLVDDETEIRRANATAVQWIVEQLGASDGTPVGVIVLWTPKAVLPGAAGTETPVFEAIFVLCRGEEVARHRFKINMVIYGNPTR
jgi:hypothetical protein